MMKRKLAAVIMAVTVLAGCTSTPAFANTDPAAEQAVNTEYSETADTSEISDETAQDTEIVRDGTTDTTTDPTDSEENETENNPPLTPAGNMTLVDNVTTSTGTKQFLTLTSREGNFYYLIIDYDKDGNENVHFLNQVDERDLIGLMDEDEAKELEERLAEKAAEEEAAKATLETPSSANIETEPEPTPEPEKVFNIAGYEIPQKTFVAIIGLALIALICLAGFIILTKKKKNETKKPDPDADYDEDYGDEIDIPEDDMDDEDFED